MPAVLKGTVPPPHLQLTTSLPWSTYNSHCYPPTSSPGPMTPESLNSYATRLHDSPLTSQDTPVPTSAPGWFTPSGSAMDTPHENTFGTFAYNQSYVTPHPSSAGPLSPHHHQISQTQALDVALSGPSSIENPAGNYSPVSPCSQGSDTMLPALTAHSKPPSPDASGQMSTGPTPMRPRSSPGEYQPWAVNGLNNHTPNMPPLFYPSSNYSSHHSPSLSEPTLDFPSDLTALQSRRLYAPIAPHPRFPGTSAPKRAREDEEEPSEQSKRRRRSDSNTSSTIELGEEDRLLIRLKDEESMPWKEIAARFQSDLGKSYQIPALQMRLKRLRERMRVWTETDIKALRSAHDYWVQNKFDIIAQKMLEFGATEKWTARQCARKWAEIDPGPTPYTTYATYEHQVPTSYPPSYAMSPVEPHHFMPYVPIQQ
ncbi:unnamed protein product [Periconia digitata]|uniref:Myb-like domain-containing protein n=1 Tax=Periconia digitata TaxID=1303443 RepID=A0A9W4XK14_9PLEO|nr:unnamed protein product [Periconia digitata]